VASAWPAAARPCATIPSNRTLPSLPAATPMASAAASTSLLGLRFTSILPAVDTVDPTVATNNTDSYGTNSSTVNIDGSYKGSPVFAPVFGPNGRREPGSGMSGFELYRRLAVSTEEMPAIFITACDEPAIVMKRRSSRGPGATLPSRLWGTNYSIPSPVRCGATNPQGSSHAMHGTSPRNTRWTARVPILRRRSKGNGDSRLYLLLQQILSLLLLAPENCRVLFCKVEIGLLGAPSRPPWL
jgi:hypothetical protein